VLTIPESVLVQMLSVVVVVGVMMVENLHLLLHHHLKVFLFLLILFLYVLSIVYFETKPMKRKNNID
jgi:hypothetical protein